MAVWTPYLAALGLGLGASFALWLLSLRPGDASIIDAWWGPGVLAALALAVGIGAGESGARLRLASGLVGLWALRLGLVMLRRRLRHGREDRRYRELRESYGASFWWKSLFIVFLLQAALQWLIALAPISAALAAPAPLGPLGWAGALAAAAGLALEGLSDAQLDRFKRDAPPGALLTAGLRRHVRYPSYTGEMIFWWGLWLIAAEVGAWWSVISPLLITFLLTRVSGAPLADEGLARKPGYAEWAARAPAFIPWRR
ncbi:MAG: DUF1295 domain-containing protein [Pikeienuella sp.]